MVEVARLESVYRFIAYRGFESPSLRHRRKKKKLPSGSFFFVRGAEKQGACAPCAGDSKGRAYRPGPLRIVQLLPLRGNLARLRRAFVVLIRYRLLYGVQCISLCPNGGPDPGSTLFRKLKLPGNLSLPISAIRAGAPVSKCSDTSLWVVANTSQFRSC